MIQEIVQIDTPQNYPLFRNYLQFHYHQINLVLDIVMVLQISTSPTPSPSRYTEIYKQGTICRSHYSSSRKNRYCSFPRYNSESRQNFRNYKFSHQLPWKPRSRSASASRRVCQYFTSNCFRIS